MILEQFSTKQELDALLANVQNFRLDLFEYNAEELNKKLHDNYSARFTNLVNDLLAKNDISLNEEHKLRIESILSDLEKEATQVEVLEVTMSFEPSERFLGEIQSWLSKNLSGNTLLDLKVDSGVIGGAVLVYKGLYKDMSISNKLEDYNFTL